MWNNITVDNTVNTFQNVSVYIHSGDMTWGKCEYGKILHLKIQIIYFKISHSAEKRVFPTCFLTENAFPATRLLPTIKFVAGKTVL